MRAELAKEEAEKSAQQESRKAEIMAGKIYFPFWQRLSEQINSIMHETNVSFKQCLVVTIKQQPLQNVVKRKDSNVDQRNRNKYRNL